MKFNTILTGIGLSCVHVHGYFLRHLNGDSERLNPGNVNCRNLYYKNPIIYLSFEIDEPPVTFYKDHNCLKEVITANITNYLMPPVEGYYYKVKKLN
jgi:hypothetical protein